MIKIYSSDNYVIIEQDANVYEYAKGHTLYTYKDGVYTIKELTQGEYKILEADVDGGDIVNDSSVPYTTSTFVEFLRQNTGFKTAPGGSGASITQVGMTLLKTGQTTSYRTGDDGDLEAGRDSSFTTLRAIPVNADGSPTANTTTNRFTDELGGTTYSNNWVIDWSTFDVFTGKVLGYYRLPQATAIWDNAIDNSLGTFGTFSGCRLWNLSEALNLFNLSLALPINYVPFSISTTGSFWTSTTRPDATIAAYSFTYQGGWAIGGNTGKTTSLRYIVVRTFTVTGTSLT